MPPAANVRRPACPLPVAATVSAERRQDPAQEQAFILPPRAQRSTR
jgi:hypothetical protein